MPSRSAAEHHEAGIAFGAQRRFAEGVRDYVEPARLNPRFSQTYYNLGVAYGELSGWKANKLIPWTGLATGLGERFEGDQKECTRRRLVSFIERCGLFLRFLGLAVLLMLRSTGGSAQLEPNTDRWGMDFRDFVVPENPRACLAACRAEPRCRAFTFRTAAVAYGRPHCWLKSDIPPARYAQGATSGIVRPGEVAAQPPAFEPNTDRRGSDFRDFAVPENPRACYDACRADARCKAFSFRSAADNDRPHCWLKDAVPLPKFTQGVVSGVVR